MKLLFDQNLSFKLCDRLADLFPGSSQVRLAGLDRADDRVIWDFAKAGGFIMVTQDADFADMAALYGPPPKVICSSLALTREPMVAGVRKSNGVPSTGRSSPVGISVRSTGV